MYEFQINIKTKNGGINGQIQQLGESEKQAIMRVIKFFKSQIAKQIHKIKIELIII